MKILVACEFSGVVRDAFKRRGHDATSYDLLDTEVSGQHYKGSVYDLLQYSWDMMIAHPPCTHLAVSGARWFQDKQQEQIQALQFVRDLMSAGIDKICIENPVSIIASRIHKPDQYIQPWMLGHGECKKTGLWLKNLLLLTPTNIVVERESNGFTRNARDQNVGRTVHELYPVSQQRWQSSGANAEQV